MKAYGRSWNYNVYDCRYCLYWKGKKKGCVYPDGCCCPTAQNDPAEFRDHEDKENANAADHHQAAGTVAEKKAASERALRKAGIP